MEEDPSEWTFHQVDLYYRAAKPVIQYWRTRTGRPTTFEDLERLHERLWAFESEQQARFGKPAYDSSLADLRRTLLKEASRLEENLPSNGI